MGSKNNGSGLLVWFLVQVRLSFAIGVIGSPEP